MNTNIYSKQLSIRRAQRVRRRINKNKEYLRLSIFRSTKYIYAQIIDDRVGKTLVSASSRELKQKMNKTLAAQEVGKLLAEKALNKKIYKVVFDRGPYPYHGRVKALAEAARAGGLKF